MESFLLKNKIQNLLLPDGSSSIYYRILLSRSLLLCAETPYMKYTGNSLERVSWKELSILGALSAQEKPLGSWRNTPG